jgi:hypothetical protein
VTSIATVSGTALVPGVSKNGRLYTRELIAKAVARAQDRLAEGDVPLTMLTHHAAGDDSTRIVGSLTSLTVAEDGSARFVAELADTEHARDIAGLVSGKKPHLRGVSIRGAWLGGVRRERVGGQTVETADDLELDGLDYTRTPGVIGAHVDDVQLSSGAPQETADGRHLIYESAEALVTITEDTTPYDGGASAPQGPFGDPGYLPDRVKRFPLGSKAAAVTAWAALRESADTYTGPQTKRIRGRIVKTLKEHGVTVSADRWLIDPVGVVDASTPVGEMFGMYSDSEPGSFCVNATNGPVSVTVSSYCVDPADLEVVLHAAVDGAAKALQSIDPDMDGDIDVPGAGAEDTDGDMESASSGPLAEAEAVPANTPEAPEETEESAPSGEQPAPAVDAANPDDEEEPAMADSAPQEAAVVQAPATTVPDPAAAPTITLSAEQFEQLLSKVTAPAVAAAETAPTPDQPATETRTDPDATPGEPPAPVTETDEAKITRLVAEGIKAGLPLAIQEHVAQNGPPTRKGLVAPVAEHTAPVNTTGLPEGWPQKPLHEYTDEEWRTHVSPATVGAILGDRATQ